MSKNIVILNSVILLILFRIKNYLKLMCDHSFINRIFRNFCLNGIKNTAVNVGGFPIA